MKKISILLSLFLLTGCITYIDDEKTTPKEELDENTEKKVESRLLEIIDESDPFSGLDYIVEVNSNISIDDESIQSLEFSDQYDAESKVSKLDGLLNKNNFTGYIDYVKQYIYVNYNTITIEKYKDNSFKLMVIDSESLQFLNRMDSNAKYLDDNTILYTYTVNMNENAELEYYLPLKINILNDLHDSTKLGAELDYFNIEIKVTITDEYISTFEVNFDARIIDDETVLLSEATSILNTTEDLEITIPSEYLENE